MKKVYILENNGFLLGVFSEIKEPNSWAWVVDTLKVSNKSDSVSYEGHDLKIDEACCIPVREIPKQEFTLLTVIDGVGNVWKEVVSDTSDTVQVYGLKTESYFESEAYHLKSWANDNGLTFKSEKIWV